MLGGLSLAGITMLTIASMPSGGRFVSPPGQRVEARAARHQRRVEGHQQGDQEWAGRSGLHARSVESLS
jgi:hypothetical protein